MRGARTSAWLRVLLCGAVGLAATMFGCAAVTSSAFASSTGPAAASGEHHVITAGSFVRLSGRGPVGTGSTPSVYQWKIVKRPARGRARLAQPTNRDPGFVATVPGTYRVRSIVTAANGRRSVDTVTVIVRADAPPIGWRLETAANDRGTIMLNGTAVPDTTEDCDPAPDMGAQCTQRASYAVFNRQTLGRVASGNTRPCRDPARVGDPVQRFPDVSDGHQPANSERFRSGRAQTA